MNFDLTGEIALVTGASRGIGRAIAMTLAQAGAQVIGTATSTSGADDISAYLSAAGLAGHGAVLNSADPASIDALMESLKTMPPGILVNNAAITRDNLLMRMSDEEWDSVLATNLSGVFRLCRACIRPMMKARRGRIINISSVVGLTGNPGQANYVASKAGLIGFSKSLAREVGSRGITVNAIAPGFIETDMTKVLPAEQRAALVAQIPLQRAGQPEDIAAAVLFLASAAGAYISGETLNVNGGMYMA
jgi:3-oxoacyl-[acyl-carrier protein] reductase